MFGVSSSRVVWVGWWGWCVGWCWWGWVCRRCGRRGLRVAGSGSVPVVGGFGLGDGVEGLVDERSGGFRFEVLVSGGVGVGWDSGVGVDRFGLGPGWRVSGVGFVEPVGGVRVYPSSGGVYEVDASVRSGLAGYTLGDVVFTAGVGCVAGAGWGGGCTVVCVRAARVGGLTSYFDAAGDPVARVDAFGNRTDWVWDAQVGHRLIGVVDPVGVVTGLDWSVPDRVRVSTSAGDPTTSAWCGCVGVGGVGRVVGCRGWWTRRVGVPRSGTRVRVRGPGWWVGCLGCRVR